MINFLSEFFFTNMHLTKYTKHIKSSERYTVGSLGVVQDFD